MDFTNSDIQTMLLDSAARLLREKAGVEYWREQRNHPHGFDRARWQQFAELGWLALPLPEAAGGLGGSLEDVALLNMELGKALATEPYVSTAVLGGFILAASADQDAMLPILAELGAGEVLIALAHEEHGSDPLELLPRVTVARRTNEGFRLSGRKIMAMDAPSADKLIVSAVIEGEDGVALFMVDPKAAGSTIAAYPLVDGTLAADLAFDDVALASGDLLVGGNTGAGILAEARDRATLALLAQAVGSMEACLDICGSYARERRQFGTAILSFQAIQHMLADMFVAAYQARSILYHALAHAADAPEERSAALSAAKIVIGEAAQLVSRNGIQIHGGYGLTDEYAISHHYRRLMAIEKLGGDIERHTRRFADQTLADR
jgi:alkylation response protein AidB-like acyl-CoA dehydrogenase